MEKLSGVMAGVAGEYFACAELSRRNFKASITIKNTPGIDIFAKLPKSNRVISIQVKTSQNEKPKWLLSENNERQVADYYIFVRIGNLNTKPKFTIVPSGIVKKAIKKKQLAWVEGRRRDGSKRKITKMRAFYDMNEKYLEKWELLKKRVISNRPIDN